MEKRTGITGNPDTPLDPESNNLVREQDGDKTTEQDPDAAPEAAKEEIVIKQVPVDGICGGY